MNNAAAPACTPEAFERLYQRAADPWDFRNSQYERRRYETTLGALLRPSYRRAYEPGCSVGELTAALSSRCDQVVAADVSPSAVEQARKRCAPLGKVEIRCADVATDDPGGFFDLVILSEIGYYFLPQRLADIAQQLAHRLEAGGEFVAVHWLGTSADHLLSGDEVHELLLASLPLQWIAGAGHEGFRIDTWVRP